MAVELKLYDVRRFWVSWAAHRLSAQDYRSAMGSHGLEVG